MCGRYNIIDDPFTRSLLEGLGIGGRLETRYNIAPTESVPVVRCAVESAAGALELVQMRWWLIPAWVSEPGTRYSMFNARAETLNESRAFRRPFQYQRCILPASSFIEWHQVSGTKEPFLIRAANSALAFAGLWDHWGQGPESILSCCIITTAAVKQFEPVHQRMPVMLAPDVWRRWLDPQVPGSELMPLLLPAVPDTLDVIPIDTAINNSRHKIAPLPMTLAPVLTIDPC
jgi:putative SOS response-associated peptidase YedK